MATPWPPNLPRTLSYPEVGIDALLAGAAREYGERAALRDGEASVTFRELYEQARRVAGALRERGIEPGDVVAMHMPNSMSFVVAYYGCLLAGAAVCPINPAQPVLAVRAQLDDVEAKAVITHPLCAKVASDADAHSVEFIVGVPGDGDLPEGVAPFADLLGAEPLQGYSPARDLVAHLQLTGGTTGRSKAVRVLQRNLVDNVIQNAALRASVLPDVDEDGALRVRQIDNPGPHMLIPGEGVHLGIAPFFHGLGLVGHNIDVLLGNTVVMCPGFAPDQFVADIETYGVTQLIGSPAMYYALLRSPEVTKRDLSSVRLILSGAAPIDTTALRRLQELFPNAFVMEGYGLSEATMGVIGAPIDAEIPTPMGSIGVELIDTEVELRDDEGMVVPDGQVGELWVRGPQVTDGYQGQPELTANQFKEGWLATGDLARRDEQGFFYIVGRAKDMIIYKGYNVYPQPLEEILCSHPAVGQAAVVGAPSQTAGEIPVAFVVLRPDVEHTEGLEEEVMAHVAERVAPYQKIRELTVLAALPTTPTGKVVKSDLRDRAKHRH